MMKTFYVTLNERSRFPKPPMGGFLWSRKFNNFAWRNKGVTTIDELAELVSEASIALNRIANPIYILGVSATEEGDAQQEVNAEPVIVVPPPKKEFAPTPEPEPEPTPEPEALADVKAEKAPVKLPKKLQALRRSQPTTTGTPTIS